MEHFDNDYLLKEANVLHNASAALKRGALNAQIQARLLGIKAKTIPTRIRYAGAIKRYQNSQQDGAQNSAGQEQNDSGETPLSNVSNENERRANLMYNMGFDKEAGVKFDKMMVAGNRYLKRRSEDTAREKREQNEQSSLFWDQRNRRAGAKNDIRNMREEDLRRAGKDYAAMQNLDVRQKNKINAAKNDIDKAILDAALERKNAKNNLRAQRANDFAATMGAIVDQRRADNDARLAIANAKRDTRRFGRQDIAEMAALRDTQRGGRLSDAERRLAESIERKEARKAEKVAAYYDEAQLMKEAAEDDYETACAYEEAALQILDELGYLD